MHVQEYVCVHVWIAEVNIGRRPRLFSTLVFCFVFVVVFELGSFPEAGAYQFG